MRTFCSWACVCLKRRTLPALMIFAVGLLLILPGCSWDSSIRDVPTLPVLESLQRATLNGNDGVWMSNDDAGRLAQWIYDVMDVTGENGQ